MKNLATRIYEPSLLVSYTRLVRGPWHSRYLALVRIYQKYILRSEFIQFSLLLGIELQLSVSIHRIGRVLPSAGAPPPGISVFFTGTLYADTAAVHSECSTPGIELDYHSIRTSITFFFKHFSFFFKCSPVCRVLTLLLLQKLPRTNFKCFFHPTRKTWVYFSKFKQKAKSKTKLKQL